MSNLKTEFPAQKIKIKLFHRTTDTDLAKGQKVVTKDVWGEFTQVGIIDRIYEDWGVLVYEIDYTAYTADEIKLIEENSKN